MHALMTVRVGFDVRAIMDWRNGTAGKDNFSFDTHVFTPFTISEFDSRLRGASPGTMPDLTMLNDRSNAAH